MTSDHISWNPFTQAISVIENWHGEDPENGVEDYRSKVMTGR